MTLPYMYIQGDLDNLKNVGMTLTAFCKASTALVNWNKSMAFWVGDENPPLWNPRAQFWWIRRGTLVRYLGCTIGINLSVENQGASLLLTSGHEI